ncbi:MAG TPA: hypothetical protein VK137_10080, partial [Planctomycetaceae bacterium]|nr:hypothetical protein [Planctomycetaceae bacterium]
LLSELRQKLAAETFDRLMDEFGTSHADHDVSLAKFGAFLTQRAGTDATGIFAAWLDREVAAKDHVGGFWSIYSFEPEPERALIVFGGDANAVANREIAERLQHAVARRFSNFAVPIKADRDMTDEDLKSHHLLVVGEPTTNSLLRRAAEKSPVRFGTQSFVVRDETFANPDSAVIAASENPWNERFSVVVFAGLSARATYRIVDSLSADEETAPQVVVFPANRAARRFAVR